jgi:Heterokaryon incompatibility protein (HET)
LLHFDLQNAPNYEALSYCWGSQSIRTPIQINDLTLEVTKNLRSALLHLRNELSSRLLWVDAICINQEDLSERASQVTIMGDIYRNAVQTIIWLGPGDENTSLAFTQLHTILSQTQAESEELGKGETSKNIGFGLDRNDSSVIGLVGNDWWTRVWVVQEVVLARNATVCWGNETMGWESLVLAIELGLAHNVWEYMVLGLMRDDSFDSFRALRSIGRSVARESLADSLLDLLVDLRNLGASDPRDKVFAALGMLGGSGSDIGISPDYLSSVEDVYIHTAASILTAAENLDLLSVCAINRRANSNLDLPSWVPDWSVTKYASPPFFKNQDTFTYKASRGSKSLPHYQDGNILVLSGHLFDSISEVGYVIPEIDEEVWDNFEDLPEDAGVRESFGSAGRAFARLYTNLVDLVPYLATYIHWEKFATINDSSNSITGESHREVYWRTLCADQMPEGYETTKSQFQEWYDSLSPIRTLQSWKADSWSSLFKPLGFLGYLRSTWTEYPAFGALISHLTLKRIARTKQGFLCLVPDLTQIGDQIWLFRGGRVPLVIRNGEKGQWDLIGEAFVHGIMNGERFDDEACGEMHFK